MAIKTATSMSGFIASDPKVTQRSDGQTRLHFRVGQEHCTRNQDDSFTQEAPTFHDLVMTGKTAEKAAQLFRKGDRFIAEGYVDTHDVAFADQVPERREEFRARHIGHDLAYTSYQVDRSPKAPSAPTSQLDTPTPAAGVPMCGLAV